MRRPPGGVRQRRKARIPRMPWQGRGATSPARGRRESVFPSAFGGFGRMRSGMRGRAACARGRRRGAFANPASVAPDIPGARAASAVGGAIPPRLALRACPPLFSPAQQPLRLLTWRRAWSPRCPRSSPARRWPRGRLAGGRRFVQVAAARQSVGFKKNAGIREVFRRPLHST